MAPMGGLLVGEYQPLSSEGGNESPEAALDLFAHQSRLLKAFVR